MKFSKNIAPGSSFDGLSEEAILTHLNIKTYRGFELTGAVTPSYDVQVRPEEGYRYNCWIDEFENCANRVPVLEIAVTRRKLLDVFYGLVNCLGETLDVVVDEYLDPDPTSQNMTNRNEHRRNEIDLQALKSKLQDFEDTLLNNGFLGVSVIGAEREIQLQRCKSIVTYGAPVGEFETVLRENDIPYKSNLEMMKDAECLYDIRNRHPEQVALLLNALRADQDAPGENTSSYM